MPEVAASARQADDGGITFSVDRPVATTMVVLAVVVFGWVSLRQLPVSLLPDLSYPTVTVRTEFGGAAPEEVEQAVSEPIEEIMRTCEGVLSVSSVSRAGSSDVILRFEWSTDLDQATQRVRERLGYVSLPEDVGMPLILRYDPALEPILRVAVHGDLPLTELRRLAEDDVQRRIETLPGVAMVRTAGGEEEVVRIRVDEARLHVLGIDISEIANRLRTENVDLAGGRLNVGSMEYLVRTRNRFSTMNQLGRLVITSSAGAPVRLEDVATLSREGRERTTITRIDASESIEVAVFREADANLVAVAEDVRTALFGAPQPARDLAAGDAGASGETQDESRADPPDERTPGVPRSIAGGLPDGVHLTLLSDQATFIRAAVDEVTQTAWQGALWATLVLFLFLRRTWATLIIGLAIPLSIVATFAAMRFAGVSMNIMSLGGLALGIGMLVDNAIVVLESIVRCREEGDGDRAAAVRGTREVAAAVVASTLTTVAVFAPIVFIEGIAGQLFGDLGLTVVISLLASLAFSLWFVPMLAALPARLRATGGPGPDASEAAPPRARLLRFQVADTFASDARRFAAAWRSARGLGRTGLAILALPIGLLALLRFLVLFPLELLVAKLGLGLAALAARFVAWAVRRLLRLLSLLARPPLRLIGWMERASERTYGLVLGVCLDNAWIVVCACIAAGWAAWSQAAGIGTQLIPELHQSEFTAHLRMPVGTALDDTALAVASVERELVGAVGIATVSSFIGVADDDVDASEYGEHVAEITVRLEPSETPAVAEESAIGRMRAALESTPGLDFEIVRPNPVSLAAPLAVEIRGWNLRHLSDTAGDVVEVASRLPLLDSVQSSVRPGFPEIRVEFDRERLAGYELDVRTVATELQSKVRGAVVTEFRPDEHALDVELGISSDGLSSIDDLSQLVVGYGGSSSSPSDLASLLAASPLASGGPLPSVGESPAPARPITLGSVARLTIARGPADIRHLDGQRAAIVTADATVVDIGSATAQLAAAVAPLRPMEGQTISIAGQSREILSAQRSLWFAFALAVFLVYLVMASTFESLIGPLVILLTVPLAGVGVIAALAGTDTPLSAVVLIGAIVLAGIVVNNAIVLVDRIRQLRARGLSRRIAIVDACTTRLRPVLMTALTTILGLLPMAFSGGEGAEVRRPLALVVSAGLATSTALTLLVVPIAYDLAVERWRRTPA